MALKMMSIKVSKEQNTSCIPFKFNDNTFWSHAELVGASFLARTAEFGLLPAVQTGLHISNSDFFFAALARRSQTVPAI